MTTPLLTPEQAWHLLEGHLAALPAVELARRECWRRVTAETIGATVDVPGQDVSAMDGYGVGPGPLLASASLPISATLAAGDPPGHRFDPTTAIRIMTGAPVPTGIDRVVPIERTDGGVDEVAFSSDTESGAHIRRRGEVIRVGEPLMAAHTAVSASVLATLATHGIERLRVHGAPTVAFVTTGNEVVPPAATPRPGQLRDSHTDFLLAACRSLALDLEPLGIASDDPETLVDAVRRGMEADVLLIGGGVSKGAFDWVETALGSCGCEILFHGVAIQPGKPLLAARHANGLVFGLPGNPNSVMATFTLLVRPALQRLMGYDTAFWSDARTGRLAGPLRAGGKLDRFIPARVDFDEGAACVSPLEIRGSHDMLGFSRANALVRAERGDEAKPPGERCRWLPLEP